MLKRLSRFCWQFGDLQIPVKTLASKKALPIALFSSKNEWGSHELKVNINSKSKKISTLCQEKIHLLLPLNFQNLYLAIQTSCHPGEYILTRILHNRTNEMKKSTSMMQVLKLFFVLIGWLPKKRKLVIFESFHAKQYSDNPRAIYETMRNQFQDYDLLWVIDGRAENLFKEFGVPYMRRYSITWFFCYPRAKYWVNNVRAPVWMPKSKGTIYIQTWHGTPLKRLGIDIEEIHMPNTDTLTYRKNFVAESKKWDFLVSPNSYSTEIFRRAFNYQGKVIESGYPRNDVLCNTNEQQMINLKKKMGIPIDKKIMLYAPTWRDNNFYEKGKYKFEFQFDLDRWKKEFESEWILLSRMHYLIAEKFDFSAYEGTVYDFSNYSDIRDLYLISDLMITDYSSVFFDFAVLSRPIIFFMYDLDQYRNQLRGFYIDIEKYAPGPIAENEVELFQAIKQIKDADMRLDPKYIAFKEKFCSLEDGKASERVIKAFLKSE